MWPTSWLSSFYSFTRRIFLSFLILCTPSFFTRSFHDFGWETQQQYTTTAADVHVCHVSMYIHINYYHLIPLAFKGEWYFLPIRVILGTLAVVTLGRKNDKCSLVILKFCNQLKTIISVGTSNSMQESRSSEVNICPTTQDTIRILRNAMVHSGVSSSSPPTCVLIRMGPLHNFPFHFFRYILILPALLHRSLSSLSQTPTKPLNYLAPHFTVFYYPLFSLITKVSFRSTFLKYSVSTSPFMWRTKVHTHKNYEHNHSFAPASTFFFYATEGQKILDWMVAKILRI
jgi:hypothetical protein